MYSGINWKVINKMYLLAEIAEHKKAIKQWHSDIAKIRPRVVGNVLPFVRSSLRQHRGL